MRKSHIALVASIGLFLVYWVTLAGGLAFDFIFLLLPGALMLPFIISFYLKLDELDKKQLDKSLWRSINWLRIPPFIMIVSILLLAFDYLILVEILVERDFLLLLGWSSFLEFLAVFLAIVSLFLKLNVVGSGMKKSFVALVVSVITFLVYLLLFLLAQFIAFLSEVTFLSWTCMFLVIVAFYLKLDELDMREIDDSVWSTIRRLKIPYRIVAVSVILFALNYVAITFYPIEVGGTFGFFSFVAMFLGMISVYLKLSMVDRGKLLVEHS